MKFALAAAVAVASLGSAALAQERVRAQDPDTVQAFLFEEGYPAQTMTDQYGDPMIRFRKGEQVYVVTFWDCTENANCASIRLMTYFVVDGAVGMEFANQLNNNNRFITAMIDSDGDLQFYRDERTGDVGLSRDEFRFLVQGIIDVAEDAQAKMAQ